ncbi:MAG: TldD/PmbA family protein [Actinomycetota bacterium]
MPGPIGPDDLREIAGAALEVSGADDVEVLAIHEWGGLTRFARSAIHQNAWREDTGVKVRVVTQGRVGVASTNDLSKAGAQKAARDALEIAQVAAPDPGFPGLAPKAGYTKLDGYDEEAAAMTPTQQAEEVAQIVGQATNGVEAAGAYETQIIEVAVANTEGQFAYHPGTQASVSVLMSGDDGGAGYAEAFGRGPGALDREYVGERAARKARDSGGPRDLDPGRYDVVLEPLAVSTLMAFLGWLGFGGRQIAEGRSCFSGRIGEKVVGRNISIEDDALAADALGMPFDFEGTPKRVVQLIVEGVVQGGVHDRRSAKQAGVESTGHALPPPNPEGPFPLNVAVATGDSTVEEMIAATERGLLITRFHYANIVHPREAIITGMTRDGTWWIENGAIAHPVKNLRFTQSILEALSNVDAIGREAELASEFFFAASRVPALKVRDFNFTGKSDH